MGSRKERIRREISGGNRRAKSKLSLGLSSCAISERADAGRPCSKARTISTGGQRHAAQGSQQLIPFFRWVGRFDEFDSSQSGKSAGVFREAGIEVIS